MKFYISKNSSIHTRSFGCLCYPIVPIPHRAKFEPRTTPHIFIGYPHETKGYKVLNMSTGKIHVSRDVVFHENTFPFNDSFSNTTGSPFSLLQSPHFIDILDDFDKNGKQDSLNSSNGPNAACDLSPNPTVSIPSPSISPAPLIVNQPR